jgi:hypothetical protein
MSSSEHLNLAVSTLAGIFGFFVASKYSEKKHEDTVQHGGGTPIDLISGHSVVYVGKYNGVKYILFGDIHSDPVKNTCNVESGCSGYFDNPLTLSKDYSEWTFTADRVPTIVPDSKCYEVSYLLTKIFEIAYVNKKNIDFILLHYCIIIMSTTVLALFGGVILVLLIIVIAMASKPKPSCPPPNSKEYIKVPAGKKVTVLEGQNGQQYVALDFKGGVGDTTSVNWTDPVWMPYGFTASSKCNTTAGPQSVLPNKGVCILGVGDC